MTDTSREWPQKEDGVDDILADWRPFISAGRALLGYGRMKAEGWREPDRDQDGAVLTRIDLREVSIYRSIDDGSLWVRQREEFEDGRFEVIAR